MCSAYGLAALEDAAVGVFGFIGRDGRPVSCAVTPYGLVSVVPVTGDVPFDADEIALQVGLPDGPVCLLAHEESAGLSDLRQLRLEGELVSGRLSVRRRTGTLAATHLSPLAQIRELRALARAATANRARIESWKARLGQEAARS